MQHPLKSRRPLFVRPGALGGSRGYSPRLIGTLIAIAIATLGLAFCEQKIAGIPRAIDGDSIAIGEQRIRLYAIDAPELGQPCISGGDCGAKAKSALADMMSGHTIECIRRTRDDRYGRMIAQCTADGVDLGREMVRSGNAMALRSISSLYAPDEPKNLDFESPSQYRERQPPERRRGGRRS
ncbi:MAG TPA: thermonuclease family protein [Alphaproteobacteria bacterium]|jgi:endonuclease YncB( thermonuclease family)|nr:thermonuclease family protein [Alphaproteobacteria bacterium]